jgi:methyl-accepting chemotaxis protein
MKIGTKLFLVFSTTVLAGIAVGGVGLFHLTQVKGLEEAMYQENIGSIEALMNAETDYLTMRVVIRDLVFSRDKAQTLDYRKKLNSLDANFRQHMKEYREVSGIDKSTGLDARTLDQFQTTYEDYQKILEALFDQVQTGDDAGAVIRMYGEGADRATAMSGQMDNLVSLVHQSAEQQYRESKALVGEAQTTTVLVLILATLFSLGAALFLTRTLARPMIRLAETAHRLSTGDLTVQSTGSASRRKDEVGTLARAVDSMAQGLTGFVKAIQETGQSIQESAADLDHRASSTALAAARIAAATQSGQTLSLEQAAGVTETTATVAQIASTVERFDRLIEDQVASVTQTTASLEEMAANIQGLSAKAAHLRSAFDGLQSSSVDGREKLYAMVKKIEEVSRQSELLAEANKTIRTIASQTNLLSMNAAIEAAHAGEAGAGFAVVADEIRKLSEQAALQSKGINTEVKDIQKLIQQVSADSETAKVAFDAVMNRVLDLGRFEAELTDALAEQSVGAQQILEATTEVSTVTAEVRHGSTEILGGSQAIHQEMDALLALSRKLESDLARMAIDGQAITEASVGVLSNSNRTRDLSVRLDEVVGVFRLS